MISFFVKGEPRPKQSFRVSGHGTGYTHPRVKAWQVDVASEADREMRSIGRFNQPYETGYLAVILEFYLGNERRVDLDNLSKAVLDGLNGICWKDDRQVVDLHLRKFVMPKHETSKVGVQVVIEPVRDIGETA